MFIKGKKKVLGINFYRGIFMYFCVIIDFLNKFFNIIFIIKYFINDFSLVNLN